MPNTYSKQIVYLSKAQYQTLVSEGSITVDGTTVTYNENDIYVTPQAEPVTDVQVNGSSVTSNGVANIPVASSTTFGVTAIGDGLMKGSSNKVMISSATDSQIKAGLSAYYPVTPSQQNKAVFYGLSKVAGADLANETVTLGTYPDASKAAIQHMLGTDTLLAPNETDPFTAAHAVGELFTANGKLYRVTAAVAISDAMTVGTNCEEVSVVSAFPRDVQINGSSIVVNGVATIPYASDQNSGGIVRANDSYGIAYAGQGLLAVNCADGTMIKAGTNAFQPIVPYFQNASVFYGLAKAAGDSTQSASSNTVGTYTAEAKAAIKTMLGISENSDVFLVTLTADPNNDTFYTYDKTYNEVEAAILSGKTVIAANLVETEPDKKEYSYYSLGYFCHSLQYPNLRTISFTDGYGSLQLYSDGTAEYSSYDIAQIFDGASQGDTWATWSADKLSQVTGVADVQVNGTSVLNNGVANVQVNNLKGITVDSNNKLTTSPAGDSVIKEGTDGYLPISPSRQHRSVFYGLAKAAGDTTQSASSNAVGTYTSEAKAAIQSMLGIDLATIATQVEIPLVETVTGTTPSITGQPNTRYNCGEVSTITIVPPASGSVDVYFTSGSTASVLTVMPPTGLTMRWPTWFDDTALEANTIYEILITDGQYGSVMTWQA